jgi:YaiO family outer membrane protein
MRSPLYLAMVGISAMGTLCEAIAGTDSARYEVDVGVEHETLNKNLPDWHARSLRIKRSSASHHNLRAGVRETDRFGQQDTQLHVGGNWQAREGLVLGLEAGYSATHHILPARYGQADLAWSIAPQWVVNAGARASSYDTGSTQVFHLGADRYWGRERFGAMLFAGGPAGSAVTSSYRLQWTHDYGQHSWVGVSLTQGRETENLGAPGFLTSQIKGAAISGRHGLGSAWALTWVLGTHQQGDAYRRSGVTLGLRHAF